MLEAPRERRFERLMGLARELFDVPIALVNLGETDLELFQPPENGLDVLVVSDARADARFRAHPLVVAEPWIRFYAGQVIRDVEGERAGTLCVMDRRPRSFTPRDALLLRQLAALVEPDVQAVHLSELAALQESEERFRLLAETSAEPMFALDRAGSIRFANPAAERTFGFVRHELIGKPFELILSSGLRQTYRRRFERYLTSGKRGLSVTGLELVGRRRDGAELPLECSLCEFAAEGERYFTGVIRDVSERKRASEAVYRRDAIMQAVGFAAERFLRPSDREEQDIDSLLAQLGTAASASRVSIFEAATHDGQPAALLRNQWTPEDIDASQFVQAVSWMALGLDRWVGALRMGEAVYGNATTFPQAERSVLASGGIRSIAVVPIGVGVEWWGALALEEHCTDRLWSDAEIRALKTAAGILGAAILRKRSEHDLRRAKDQAETASIAKSQFLANMSHELRTPLNSVIGFTNILVKNRDQNLLPNDLKYLERIRANGKHLLELINDVLDLSKVEAGKLELDHEPVALRDLVDTTLAQLEVRTLGKDVRLVLDSPDHVAPILADAARLKQIVINLVGNALKFTDQGTITAEIGVDPSGLPVRLAVRDTGIGIPADRLEAIFNAFEQADTSTTRNYGGSGLGLAICRSLCNLMGYRLTLESEVGVGSIFTVWLDGAEVAAEAGTVEV